MGRKGWFRADPKAYGHFFVGRLPAKAGHTKKQTDRHMDIATYRLIWPRTLGAGSVREKKLHKVQHYIVMLSKNFPETVPGVDIPSLSWKVK